MASVTPSNLLVWLDDPHATSEGRVGSKAATLAKLRQASMPVAEGFALTGEAFSHFLKDSGIAAVIEMELGRKSGAQTRWEELWDAALRIRSSFLATPMPGALKGAISEATSILTKGAIASSGLFAVRSSALDEDGASASFAGLHETRLNVEPGETLIDAVKIVWASLWSNAALLYREDLKLDPRQSQMGVLIQPMVYADWSGVAFSRDPRDQSRDQLIIEATPGLCENLVDGKTDPDRWVVARQDRSIISHQRPAAEQHTGDASRPEALSGENLSRLFDLVLKIEHQVGQPVDVEWTGWGKAITILQARPITTGNTELQDDRAWYLSLTPNWQRLEGLAKRVSQQLVPELRQLGNALAKEELKRISDAELALAIKHRFEQLDRWRQIYKEEFIPFAHGVRYFGSLYNELLRPSDPYEFVSLLSGQSFLAMDRHWALGHVAKRLAKSKMLLGLADDITRKQNHLTWDQLRVEMSEVREGDAFFSDLVDVAHTHFDVTYGETCLTENPMTVLMPVVQIAQGSPHSEVTQQTKHDDLEQRLLHAAGSKQREHVESALKIGRISWKLRDDDNLFLGRVESQLLRATNIGADRLRASGRLSGGFPTEKQALTIAAALSDRAAKTIVLEPRPTPSEGSFGGKNDGLGEERVRQLIGQPASPGLAAGTSKHIQTSDDLISFRPGQIILCDAIQPTMTHIVPLAAAIVERRGGMLIHGAIIARELGIPCVNGVADAINEIADDTQVSVDGWLGIVTVGAAELALERQLEVAR